MPQADDDPGGVQPVEQDLDLGIVDRRRIDALALGTHSHRTVDSGLKFRPNLKNLDPPVKDAEPAKATGVPGPSSGVGGAVGVSMGRNLPNMSGPKGGGGADAAAAEDEDTPVNKMRRLRYLHVTDQCRHLPIGMKLIVDQAHIQDVLAA